MNARIPVLLLTLNSVIFYLCVYYVRKDIILTSSTHRAIPVGSERCCGGVSDTQVPREGQAGPEHVTPEHVTARSMLNNRISANRTTGSSGGPVDIQALNVSMRAVLNLHRDVQAGGTWAPARSNINGTYSLALIIPYRERRVQLMIFLNHIHAFLRRQNVHYRIYLVEQLHPKDVFNKGAMMNIGYKEARADRAWDCYIFHDIDMLPEHPMNLYRCQKNPIHFGFIISKYKYRVMYDSQFGGVIGLTEHHILGANGFSNNYWGWGGEDDDMRIRVTKVAGYKTVARPARAVGRYTAVPHAPIAKGNVRNPKRALAVRWKGLNWYKADGLSSLRYDLLRKEMEPLYTWILASVSRETLQSSIAQLLQDHFT